MRIRMTTGILVIVTLLLAATLATADNNTVKIGVTLSQTGKYTDFGIEMLQGLEMFIEDVNGRGGASGRTVELVVYDDESDRETAARLYEKLIVEDKIDLLIGPYSTPLTLAVTEVTERYDFPIVVTGTGLEIFERGMRNVFGIYTPAPQIMRPILELAQEKGLKRVAIGYADNEAPTSIAEGVQSQVSSYGLELVFNESYGRNTARPEDFKGLIQRMRASQPEVAIFGSYLEDSAALLKEARAQDFAPDVMVFSYGPALHDFGPMVGAQNAEGVMATSQWQRGQHMPGAFDFNFRFKKRTGRNASYPAAGAYASGQVIEAASRLAGRGSTSDEYREQLRNMNFTSLLGPYRVDETGLQVGKPIFVLQWQGGQRELVFPSEFARAPIQYPFPAWESR